VSIRGRVSVYSVLRKDQTVSLVHPTFYSTGAGALFSELKRPDRKDD